MFRLPHQCFSYPINVSITPTGVSVTPLVFQLPHWCFNYPIGVSVSTHWCFSYDTLVFHLPQWSFSYPSGISVSTHWGFSNPSCISVTTLWCFSHYTGVSVTSQCCWCPWMDSNPSTWVEGWPQSLIAWWPVGSTPPTCAPSTQQKPSLTTTPSSRSVPTQGRDIITGESMKGANSSTDKGHNNRDLNHLQ